MNTSNNILESTEENYKLAAKCVTDGGVIVTPSDTNLALTLNPWIDQAIDRAFAVKNRPATSPLTLFFLDPEEWRDYALADDPGVITALAEAFWPGPLNIILKKKSIVPNRMVLGGETVALGCLSNPIWRGFMKYMKLPVSMTSANLSGQADGILVDMNVALNQVGDKVDYILKGEAQGTTKSSTIIDLSGAEPRITRYGDVTIEQLNLVTNIFKQVI
jgi:L-threonylcarbamoyladenylate synthase